jgi:hypothetical protein
VGVNVIACKQSDIGTADVVEGQSFVLFSSVQFRYRVYFQAVDPPDVCLNEQFMGDLA